MKQQAPSHATDRTDITTSIETAQTSEQATVEQAQPTLPGIPAVLATTDARFRINETTRRIGLAGVARARAVLAEQAARREEREAARSGQRTPQTRGQQQAA